VQAIPALQTLAVLRGRDFVSSEDLETLAPLIKDVLRQPIEALSRATLLR
jgi:hypothetical protein